MSGIFKEGAYYPIGISEEMSEGEYQAMLDAEMDDGSPEYRPVSLNEKAGYWRKRDGSVVRLRNISTTRSRCSSAPDGVSFPRFESCVRKGNDDDASKSRERYEVPANTAGPRRKSRSRNSSS